MRIEHDYSYISSDEFSLNGRGYGKLSVYSIHFNRWYSDEEKQRNAQAHAAMTIEQWRMYCDNITKSFEQPMAEILELLCSRYNIHQVSKETSTMEHYRSDWDLFYNSHTIVTYDGKNVRDGFTLTFNDRRTPEQNNKLLENIIQYMENIEHANICCRVQYCIILEKEKIASDAERVFETLNGKYVEYYGRQGKIKIVGESDGEKKYGFFVRMAKKRYYTMSAADVLALSFE